MIELPFQSRNEWRWRWMYTPDCRVDGKLHRIAAVERREDYEWVGVVGKTVCGLRGQFQMPGVLSRMERDCCRHCCRRLGIPAGAGAPVNRGLEA